MTPPDDNTPKKPGRKAETPAERIRRLERDLLAAKQAAKEAEQRKLAAIGAAVLAEADSDSEFRAKLRDILHRRVTAKSARADVAMVLAEQG